MAIDYSSDPTIIGGAEENGIRAWFSFLKTKLSGVVFGTGTLKRIHVDGVGDGTPSVADGDVKASGNVIAGALLEGGTGIVTPHLVGAGSAPGVVLGAGAGSSTMSSSYTGTDLSALMLIHTGASPTGANAIIATITFAVALPAAARVLISPANSNAAALTGAFVPYIGSTSTTTFVLNAGSSGLTAGTDYQWYVTVSC